MILVIGCLQISVRIGGARSFHQCHRPPFRQNPALPVILMSNLAPLDPGMSGSGDPRHLSPPSIPGRAKPLTDASGRNPDGRRVVRSGALATASYRRRHSEWTTASPACGFRAACAWQLQCQGSYRFRCFLSTSFRQPAGSVRLFATRCSCFRCSSLPAPSTPAKNHLTALPQRGGSSNTDLTIGSAFSCSRLPKGYFRPANSNRWGCAFLVDWRGFSSGISCLQKVPWLSGPHYPQFHHLRLACCPQGCQSPKPLFERQKTCLFCVSAPPCKNK